MFFRRYLDKLILRTLKTIIFYNYRHVTLGLLKKKKKLFQVNVFLFVLRVGHREKINEHETSRKFT